MLPLLSTLLAADVLDNLLELAALLRDASLDDAEVAEAVGDVVEALLRETDLPEPWGRIVNVAAEPLGALAAAVIMRHMNEHRRAARRDRRAALKAARQARKAARKA